MNKCAAKEGTCNYLKRHGWKINEAGHLYTSPIGIGNHLGSFQEEDSRQYVDTMVYALENGINVLDTAINYRGMRSEKDTGAALACAMERGSIKRDEVVVQTKAGLLFGDISRSLRPKDYLAGELAETGVQITDFQEYDGLYQTLNPDFYRKALEISLDNLQLDCVDIHYIHIPEISRAELGETEFYRQLKALFQCYEKWVSEGKIQYYGMALEFMIFEPEEAKWQISLEEIQRIAEEAAGVNNHFKYIQLPFNLRTTSAANVLNQRIGAQKYNLLDAAHKLGFQVVGSMPLAMGKEFAGKTATDFLEFCLKETRISWFNCGSKNPIHIQELIDFARLYSEANIRSNTK